MKKLMTIGFVILSCLILSACLRPYKVEIQQGNILSEENVANVHKGMTHEQVMSRLGTPVLVTAFNPNEMIYVYSLKKGYHPVQVRRLFIYFQNGQVVDYKFEHESKSRY